MNKTKVIFRYWKGNIIALFPELPGTIDPDTCQSYTSEKRHSTCFPEEVIKKTRFATPEEYRDIRATLEGCFAYDLIPIRLNRSHHKDIRIKRIPT